jgi:hypothetical protein
MKCKSIVRPQGSGLNQLSFRFHRQTIGISSWMPGNQHGNFALIQKGVIAVQIKCRCAISLAVLSALLAGCGGEGTSSQLTPVSAQPSPSPSPSPSPTPTSSVTGTNDRIIYSASQSVIFADEGRYWTDGGLTVRYDSGTGFYYAADPATTEPGVIGRMPGYTPPDGQPWQQFVTANGVNITAHTSGQPGFAEPYRYLHSNLLSWSLSGLAGTTAIGLPTTEGLGPNAGSTLYRGHFSIFSDQLVNYEGQMVRDGFAGVVELRFDAADNSAQLALLPRAGEPPMTNSLTLVWTSGASSFFQRDPASATSLNYPVSGRFTGPAAEELIGGLRFNYVSPLDGKTYEARGAFVAKR